MKEESSPDSLANCDQNTQCHISIHRNLHPAVTRRQNIKSHQSTREDAATSLTSMYCVWWKHDSVGVTIPSTVKYGRRVKFLVRCFASFIKINQVSGVKKERSIHMKLAATV
jgi:hypothetical protein